MPENLPTWLPALLTAIGSIITGVIAGLAAYKNQSKQLKNDWNKAQTEMKRAGTDEFEAINSGNKALREALMEQIKNAHKDYDKLRFEHERCSERNDVLMRQIRRLETKLRMAGMDVVYYEYGEEDESSTHRG